MAKRKYIIDIRLEGERFESIAELLLALSLDLKVNPDGFSEPGIIERDYMDAELSGRLIIREEN